MFGSLDFAIVPDHPRAGLGFEVATANVRTRMLRIPIAGSGIAGTVIAFARRQAVRQPDIAEIARSVVSDEFAGATALVTGGSQGVGRPDRENHRRRRREGHRDLCGGAG